MSRRKNNFTKAMSHLKSNRIDEKINQLEEQPTNNTYGLMTVGDPSQTVQPPDIEVTELDFNKDNDIDDGKNTSGIFNDEGEILTIEPNVGDTSYILGPMASMWYAWGNFSTFGYIREADRKMVNLGTIVGKLSDWDQNQFNSYGQMTLEQAVWFYNTPKKDNAGNDPDNANYRAFYPGPPSNTPDAFGRYLCTITGTPKEFEKTPPPYVTNPTQGPESASDQFSGMLNQLKDAFQNPDGSVDWDKVWEAIDAGLMLWDAAMMAGVLFPEAFTSVGGGMGLGLGKLVRGAANLLKGASGVRKASQKGGGKGSVVNNADLPSNVNKADGPFTRGEGGILYDRTGTQKTHADGRTVKANDSTGGAWTSTGTDSGAPKGSDFDNWYNDFHGLSKSSSSSKTTSSSSSNYKAGQERTLDAGEIPTKGKNGKYNPSDLNITDGNGNTIAKKYKDKNGNWKTRTVPDKNSSVSDVAQWSWQERSVSGKSWDNYMKTGELPKGWDIGGLATKSKSEGGLATGPSAEVKSKVGAGAVVAGAAAGAGIGYGINKAIEKGSKFIDDRKKEHGGKKRNRRGRVKDLIKRRNIKTESLIVEEIQSPEEMDEYMVNRLAELLDNPEFLKRSDKIADVLEGKKGKKGKKKNVKESVQVLTESKRRILREIKKPYKVPKTPTKFKGIRPKVRVTGKGLMEVPEIPKQFKPEPTIWRKSNYDKNVKASQEKKNEVLEYVGAAADHWEYLTETRRKEKNAKRDAFYSTKKDRDFLYDYWYGGKKHKVTRKEDVDNDCLVYIEDEDGKKFSMLQSKLNEMLEEEKIKDMFDSYIPEEEQGEREKNFDKVTRLKSIVGKIKRGDIGPEYPNEPPPELVNGWHPKLGKKYKHDKLDPQSAEAMPDTGDPEIDANIKKATDAKSKARKLKTLLGKKA